MYEAYSNAAGVTAQGGGGVSRKLDLIESNGKGMLLLSNHSGTVY